MSDKPKNAFDWQGPSLTSKDIVNNMARNTTPGKMPTFYLPNTPKHLKPKLSGKKEKE